MIFFFNKKKKNSFMIYEQLGYVDVLAHVA